MAIAMASNKSIVIIRVSDMSPVTTLTGHADWVRSVEFSPDGKKLVSCSDDKTVRLWNLESKSSLKLADLPDWGTKAAFTPDGRRIVCGSKDGILRVYDVRTSEEIREFQIKHPGYLNSFDITSSGDQVICGSADPVVHIWDCGDSMDTGISIHMDGAVYEFSCYGEPARMAAATNKGILGIWDMRDKSPVSLKSLGAGDVGRVETLVTSPDGDLIALASKFRVRLFSGEDGEELDMDNQGGHRAWVRSIRFSHDGTMLASVGEDGRIIIWDIAQRRIRKSVNTGSVGLYSVDFSHDGKFLITGDSDGVIRKWNVATGESIGDPIKGHTGVVLSVQFNHDDSLILAASGDQTASIWTTDGGLVRRFVGASGFMQDAIFSPDEDEIITASADRYIRIWCVSNGEETARLVGHFGAVSHLAWDKDGRLVSSDMLGEIKVWDVPNLKNVAYNLTAPREAL
jgi:WD40 repeat protein